MKKRELQVTIISLDIMMKTRSATFYFKICKQNSLKRNERIKYIVSAN